MTRAFGDLLDAIDQLDEEGTIFIREGPIEDSSEAVVISQGQEPPPGFRGGYSVRKAGPNDFGAQRRSGKTGPLSEGDGWGQLVRSGNFAGRRWPCAP